MQDILRPLLTSEINILKRLQRKMKKTLATKEKWHHYVIALLAGIAGTYLAFHLKMGFVQGLSIQLAIIGFSLLIFMLYTLYRTRRSAKNKLSLIDALLAEKQVKVTPVDALKMAVAEEFKNEKQLYIIAYELNKVFYFNDYGFGRAYPCLKFEIYEDAFFEATGRRIHPLSEKIEPLIISSKHKWTYLEKKGWPEHLTTEPINFDALVKAYLSSDINISSNESN